MNPRFCPSIILLYIVASVAALFGRYERECILSSLRIEGMLEVYGSYLRTLVVSCIAPASSLSLLGRRGFLDQRSDQPQQLLVLGSIATLGKECSKPDVR